MDPITLISPEGLEYTVATEAQYHDLVEGRGYRPKTPSPQQGHTTRAATSTARSAAAQQSSTQSSTQSSDQSAS